MPAPFSSTLFPLHSWVWGFNKFINFYFRCISSFKGFIFILGRKKKRRKKKDIAVTAQIIAFVFSRWKIKLILAINL